MNLFAIVQDGTDRKVRRIRTQRGLQTQLDDEFHHQSEKFFGESEGVVFDPRDKLDPDEIFVIGEYSLPDFISDAMENINQVDDLQLGPNVHIKSVFAAEFDHSTAGELHIYFQDFTRRRLLVSGWTLLLNQSIYSRMQDHGLVLDSSLVMVYIQGEGLFFRSYTIANRILDLTQYFAEATDDDIRSVLGDGKFQVDDEDAILAIADSVMRKRFMAVKESDILKYVTVRKAQNLAKKFGVEVRTKGGRILFPTERKEVKALLRFFLEGYYEGPISGNKYMTNSQRRVEE